MFLNALLNVSVIMAKRTGEIDSLASFRTKKSKNNIYEMLHQLNTTSMGVDLDSDSEEEGAAEKNDTGTDEEEVLRLIYEAFSMDVDIAFLQKQVLCPSPVAIPVQGPSHLFSQINFKQRINVDIATQQKEVYPKPVVIPVAGRAHFPSHSSLSNFVQIIDLS